MTHVTTHITCQLLREENEGRARGIGVRSRARGVMCRLVPASDHDRHVARNTAPTCERSTTVPPRIPASTIPYPGNFNVHVIEQHLLDLQTARLQQRLPASATLVLVHCPSTPAPDHRRELSGARLELL